MRQTLWYLPQLGAPQTPLCGVGGLDSRMVQARQCFIGLFRPQAHFNREVRTPETLKPRPWVVPDEASAGAMDAIEYSLEQGNKLGVLEIE